MGTRKNTFLLKRSNVQGKIPTSGQISLGEIVLNTADVILYASGTTTNSVLPIGWDRIHRTGDTMTGALYTPTISATTITAMNYNGLPLDIRVTGGTFTGTSNNITFTNNTGGTFAVTGVSRELKYYAEFSAGPATSPIVLSANSIAIGGLAEARNENMFVVGYGAGQIANGVYASNFIGYAAGSSADGAYESNFFGLSAGNSSSGAHNSNFIGSGVGYLSNNSFNSNFIGNNTGSEARSPYSNLFGYNVGTTFGSNYIGRNNIIIGTNISLPNGTTDGINIGGVLFGSNTSFITGVTDPSIVAQTNGRIGINVVNPTEALDVSGNALISGRITGTSFVMSGAPANTLMGTSGSSVSAGTNVSIVGNVISVTGITGGTFSGGTVTGPTTFIAGLTANTISATTYYNIPIKYYAEFSGDPSHPPTATGADSIAIGDGAKAVSNNMFVVGLDAGGSNATGSSESIFIGSSAGLESYNSFRSNFVGSNAGRLSNNLPYSNLIGCYTGAAVTGSSFSNLIGYSVGSSFTGNLIGSNNIIIGTNISLPNATANAINLGGVLFGSNTYSISGGSPSITAQTNGRIGINVVSPTQALDVSGNTKISGYIIMSSSTGATASTNTVVIYNKNVGGRQQLSMFDPSGYNTPLQPSFGGTRPVWWQPLGNATTVPITTGIIAASVVTAAIAVNVTTTNVLTRMKRLRYATTATAGQINGPYWGAGAQQYTIGDGAGLGGFHNIWRFGIADAATVTGARCFVGWRNSVAAFTNVEPSTLTDCFGMAQLATDATQWYIVYGGSAAQTPIALGTALGAPTLTTTAWELDFFAPPNSNNTVNYTVTNLGTNVSVSGTLTGTAGTALPASTLFLAPSTMRTNNATALAVQLDVCSLYIETNY